MRGRSSRSKKGSSIESKQAERQREHAEDRSLGTREQTERKADFCQTEWQGGKQGGRVRGCKGGGGGRRGSKEVFAVRERSRREKQEGGMKGLISESYRPSRGLKKVEVEGW